MFRRGVAVASTVYPRTGFTLRDEHHTAHHYRALYRAGLVRPGTAPGTHAMMPLGHRVLSKIVALVDAEMSRLGAHRLTLPQLMSDSAMKVSGRWDEFGPALFRIKDHADRSLCLGPTHEEGICSVVSGSVPSYHDLPLKLYQVEPKFRDESHTGLMRTREFLMKDMYTFDIDMDKAQQTFQQVCGAYQRIFSALELPVLKVAGDMGLMGGHMSCEFQSVCDAGEDKVHVCSKCGAAWNSEMQESQGNCGGAGCEIEEKRTAEVGHCFLLGTKYSDAFNVKYAGGSGGGDDETLRVSTMGCYGIGISRLVATVVETHIPQDCSYMVWPKAFAPFSVHVLSLGNPRDERLEKARSIAEMINDYVHKDEVTGKGHLPCHGDVVLDDRLHWRDGVRLKEAEYQGSPYVVIVGKKSSDGLYELQHQPSREKELLTADALLQRLGALITEDQRLDSS